MKLNLILLLTIAAPCAISMEKEKQDTTLKGMLIEPASLVFLAAWNAVANGEDLEKVGEPAIVELADKIKNIQQCSKCSNLEKKFFVNIVNNPRLSLKKISQYLPELLDKYLAGQKLISKKQLLNRMLLSGVENNNIELTKLSADLGAVVNWAQTGQPPLLILAVENNYPEIVNILLNKGANINIRDKHGNTPLIVAVKKDNKDLVNLLINRGADINVKDYIGNTPLIWTTQDKDKEDIAAILLNNNADVNLSNRYGNTALILASAYNYKKLVKILLTAHADTGIKNNDGDTALIKAVFNNNKDIVEMLTEAGANPMAEITWIKQTP